jgi:hypothetical protein
MGLKQKKREKQGIILDKHRFHIKRTFDERDNPQALHKCGMNQFNTGISQYFK